MANTLVTPSWVMKEGMFRLVNSLKFTGELDKQYDKQYVVDGAKVGNVVNARLPVQYNVTEGDAFQAQDVQERIVPIEITDLLNVAIEFGSRSLTLEVDNYRERYLEPAFDQLANEVDKRNQQRMAQATATYAGTPAVPPGSTGTLPGAATDPYLEVGEKLDMNACPVDNRVACLAPRLHRYLVQGVQSLFNPVAAIAANYRKGMFGNDQLGVERWYKTQTTYRHTIGPLGGTPLINGAGQTGASLVTDGWTAAAATRLHKGDKIEIENVNHTNPLNKTASGFQRTFTVTADVASDGSGNATIPIDPPIYGPGDPYQNVDALPADGAAITIFGHASSHADKQTWMNPIFVKAAYAFVSADLEKMGGAWIMERIRSKAIGLAFRLWKDRDIRTNSSPCRVDLLFGVKAVREQLGGVVIG
ncbi:MAG: P22 phage major capsid protein family protein [Vicinamibacterales bacterium]